MSNYSAMELASAFIQAGELDDALDVLSNHLKTEPGDQEAHRLYAEVLARIPERRQDAITALLTLYQLRAEDYLRCSALYESLGDTGRAEAIIEKALAVYPDHERLLERRIGLLQASGNLAEARAIADRLPRSWRWLQWSGDLAAQAGDTGAALSHYNAAIDGLSAVLAVDAGDWGGPIKARLLLARAAVQRQREAYDESDADLAAAGILLPDDPTIGFNRGLIACLRGDHGAALDLCRQGLASAPPYIAEAMHRELQADPRYAKLATDLDEVAE